MIYKKQDIISIHAPPRGATRHFWMAARFAYFNSRPSARGDGIRERAAAPTEFQFTPLREGRLGIVSGSIWSIYFNSRPSARGDRRSLPCARWGWAFQFTPLREGRPLKMVAAMQNVVFQFTPLREGRHAHAPSLFVAEKFQFTPLREGRRQKICNFCKSFVQPLQISMA